MIQGKAFIVFVLTIILGIIFMKKRQNLNENNSFKNTLDIIYMLLYKVLFYLGTLYLLNSGGLFNR